MKKNPYPGKFIVFEGLDGSGSSTEAKKLVDYLNTKGEEQRAYLTKEPTNNLIGGLIRGQLTHEWQSKQECLQLLFAADRAHHLEREIVPLLQKGVTVVSDRYFFSTIAFGSVEINEWSWLKAINDRFILPDMTIILKVSPQTCVRRMANNRFELELFEKEKTLAEVWLKYEQLAKEYENVQVIDGESSIDQVFSQIKDLADNQLKK